jgi:MFS family permease
VLVMLRNKQILYLFISGFAVLFTGMGLFPILPLYAAKFNATNSLIGFYFAIMYAANSLGPVVVGWLIARVSKRALFIGGALTGAPALFLLGFAQNFVQVIALTSLVWFSGGVVMAVVSILTSMHTDTRSRGKAYSLMAMVGPLGALVGGASVGWLVSWQGYALMFILLAVTWSVIPLIGWFGLKEGAQEPQQTAASRTAGQGEASTRFGSSFMRVLVITFLGGMAINVGRLGSSISMKAMDFSPEAVSSAAMISGLIAIPVTLLIGTLSDRLGRKHFLAVSYLLIVSSALILVTASQLWQFWLASILNLLAFTVNGAMSQAVTSEVVPSHALSKGLSLMNITGAASNILCFAAAGVLFDVLGLASVYLITALIALGSAAAIEAMVRPARSIPAAAECSEA